MSDNPNIRQPDTFELLSQLDLSGLDQTGNRNKFFGKLHDIDQSICTMDDGLPILTKKVTEGVRGLITLTYDWESDYYEISIFKFNLVLSKFPFIADASVGKRGLKILVADPFEKKPRSGDAMNIQKFNLPIVCDLEEKITHSSKKRKLNPDDD